MFITLSMTMALVSQITVPAGPGLSGPFEYPEFVKPTEKLQATLSFTKTLPQVPSIPQTFCNITAEIISDLSNPQDPTTYADFKPCTISLINSKDGLLETVILQPVLQVSHFVKIQIDSNGVITRGDQTNQFYLRIDILAEDGKTTVRPPMFVVARTAGTKSNIDLLGLSWPTNVGGELINFEATVRPAK
jgi:hypothetical protein